MQLNTYIIIQKEKKYSEIIPRESLIPDGVEGGLDGLGLHFHVVRTRDELHLDVGIRQTVGIHGNQVLSPKNCGWKKQSIRALILEAR